MQKLSTQLTRVLAAGVFAAGAAAPALAAGELWTDDMAAAMSTAQSEGKDIIIDFTGSDWCGWCIKLDEEVFSQEAFQTYATENFVLVVMDFPRDTSGLSAETIAQNEEWRDRIGVRGYPTISLLDSEGKPYAQTGYQAGGPDAYVAHLQELQGARVERDEKLAAANEAEGPAKAALIGEALAGLDDALVLGFYQDELAAAAEADPQDESGVTAHYAGVQAKIEFEATLQETMRNAMSEGPDAAAAAIDELISTEDPQGESLQMALMMKSQLFFMQDDKENAEALLREAMAIDAESETGQMIEQVLGQYFAPAEDE